MRMTAVLLCLILVIAICGLCYYGNWRNHVVSKEFVVGYASGTVKTNGLGCRGGGIMEEIDKFKARDLAAELMEYLSHEDIAGYSPEEIRKATIRLNLREGLIPRSGFAVTVESKDFGLTEFVARELGNFMIDYVDSYRNRGRDKAMAMISSRLYRMLKSPDCERELMGGMKELHKEYALALKAFENRTETIFEVLNDGRFSDFVNRASIRFWIKGELRNQWLHEMLAEVNGSDFVNMLVCTCRELNEEYAKMSDESLLELVESLRCRVDEAAAELCIYVDGAELGKSLDLLVASQYAILALAIERQKNNATYQRIYVDTVNICRHREFGPNG